MTEPTNTQEVNDSQERGSSPGRAVWLNLLFYTGFVSIIACSMMFALHHQYVAAFLYFALAALIAIIKET